jgi:thymidylate synthase (FAD)
MKIISYGDMSVKLLSCTSRPEGLIRRALSLTTGVAPRRKNFLETVWRMGHESVFEHVVFSFLVRGLSRNAVMQLTRHRLCSFTVSSQHYRAQHRPEASFSTGMLKKHRRELQDHMDRSAALYERLLLEFPKEEARQVLPGAIKADLVWTVNARELALFLRLRRCSRNVSEVRLLAEKIFKESSRAFPLMKTLGRLDCEAGKCRQGKMRCGRNGK